MDQCALGTLDNGFELFECFFLFLSLVVPLCVLSGNLAGGNENSLSRLSHFFFHTKNNWFGDSYTCYILQSLQTEKIEMSTSFPIWRVSARRGCNNAVGAFENYRFSSRVWEVQVGDQKLVGREVMLLAHDSAAASENCRSSSAR